MRNGIIVRADPPEEKPVSASAMQIARDYDEASAYTRDIVRYILRQDRKKREADRRREEYLAGADQI